MPESHQKNDSSDRMGAHYLATRVRHKNPWFCLLCYRRVHVKDPLEMAKSVAMEKLSKSQERKKLMSGRLRSLVLTSREKSHLKFHEEKYTWSAYP